VRVFYSLLSGRLVPTFAHRGVQRRQRGGFLTTVFSDFLDWSIYFFFQVPIQLYSRGCVDSFQDPLLLRKSGSAGNRTRTSGSVARNSDHCITEEVLFSPIGSRYSICVILLGHTILTILSTTASHKSTCCCLL
jgi:hypothetical protein